MQKPRIYFDNAATTPILPVVVERMYEVMTQHFGNPSSIHHEGRKSRSIIEQARKTVAGVLNASIGEIFFTSGGTEANNTAIKCAVRDLGVDCIITSRVEHHCVLHSVEHIAAEHPVKVFFVDNDELGRISLEHLTNLLHENASTKTLVSIMHANNEIGTLNDIASISQICQQTGALFHTDTVQTIGHLPIDLQALHINFLSGAAHKFHGPKGVGFLYINGQQHIKPFIDGGAQERNMRGGTENIYGIAGLAVALKSASDHMSEHQEKIAALKLYFKERLVKAFPEISFNGCPNNSLETVLSVRFPSHPKNEMLLMLLDIHGISASGGSACSSGSEKGSHVLEAIGADSDSKSIRFSFSHFNTKEEVDQTIAVLQNILIHEAVPA
jgi:cysteine desulfurase